MSSTQSVCFLYGASFEVIPPKYMKNPTQHLFQTWSSINSNDTPKMKKGGEGHHACLRDDGPILSHLCLVHYIRLSCSLR